MIDEIEVICSSCSFPTVTETDSSGKVTGFHEVEAPKTEEAALATGWTDSGLGLLCPACTARAIADLKREVEQGIESGAGTEKLPQIKDAVAKTTFAGMLRSMHPDVSVATINIFAELLRANELANSAGMSAFNAKALFEKFKTLVPTDEVQAAEFIAVAETVKAAMIKVTP